MRITRSTGGFTIIEVAIVIALGVFLVAITAPSGVAFYRAQVADGTVENVTAKLRRASRNASLGKDDSAFGVRPVGNQLVLFRGSSYADRDPAADEITVLPSTVSIEGLGGEVVFARGSGIPSVHGTLTIALYETRRSVVVDDRGMVFVLP